MALTDKLSAIGDAIREKTGKEELIKLDDMPQEIASISTGDDSLLLSLIDTTLTDLNTDKITTIGNYGLAYRNHLKSVNLPKLEHIGEYAFSQCRDLTTAVIPTSITRMPFGMFHQCSSFNNFDFTNITALEPSALYNTGFEELIFSNLTFIGINAIANNSKLKKVDFYKKVELHGSALNYCPALETVILRNVNEISLLLATNALNGSLIANGTGYIYVPKALIEEYKVATNWVTFANQFRAIEDYPEICGGAE